MPSTDSHSAAPDTRAVVGLDDAPPPGYIALCWEVFFRSRGRGVAMDAHFPWLHVPGQAVFVTLRVDDAVIAGCAMRFIDDRTRARRGAAIGLVCVDAKHRGQGHSSRVLERAIAHADALGLADLVLWTGKPGVYERHGFALDDDGLYGSACAPAGMAPLAVDATQDAWPGSGDTRGLPPFAASGERWQSADASAIVVRDARGPILAEWQGPDAAVADLLAHAMPPAWRINALAGDGLPALLAERGFALDLQPSRLRMRRPAPLAGAAPRRYDLRVLDRI
ncbi:MAG: GNAT family N-acetyltransferase [Vitreoscilla sp.]